MTSTSTRLATGVVGGTTGGEVLGLGDMVTGPVKVATVLSNTASGRLNINGRTDTTGHAIIHDNPYRSVEIVNDCPFKLDIENIDTFDDAKPEVRLEGAAARGLWTYELAATPGDMTVNILDHNARQGEILIEGSINAPTADITISADAGGILAQVPKSSNATPPVVLTHDRGDQDLGGLEIAMDDHSLMRMMGGPGDESHEIRGGFRRPRLARAMSARVPPRTYSMTQ